MGRQWRRRSAASTVADGRPERGPAILMATRRFWPHTDDAVGRLTQLADGLRRGGARPTILAARYAASWPRALDYREIPTFRPVAAPRGDWSGALYQRGLARWLREHVAEFDILYADSMREEGAAIVEAALRAEVPSVVRCGGSGGASDGQWANSSRAARRCFNLCLRADALVAPTAAAARALIACGAAAERVHRIDDGVPPGPRRDEASIAAARVSLALANGDLHVPRGGRVVMCTARMDASSGVMLLAEAIIPLCERWPELRVWFIGDGPQREMLHGFLQSHAIRGMTALPGCFGHIDELLRAADVLVVPSDADALEHRLPAAIGAGLPVVVVDTPETRSLLGIAAKDIPMFATGDVGEMRRALITSIEDPRQAARRAANARNMMRRLFPREHSVAAHLQWFHRLSHGEQPTDLGRSTGAVS